MDSHEKPFAFAFAKAKAKAKAKVDRRLFPMGWVWERLRDRQPQHSRES